MRVSSGFTMLPACRGPQLLRRSDERPRDSLRRRFSSGLPAGRKLPDDPLARSADLARLEAALFSAEEPLAIRRLTEVADLKDATETRALLAQLREHLKSSGAAFGIEEIAGGFRLLTDAAYSPWLGRLRPPGHGGRLTPAAMETLTVLAYKQPLSRADLDGIRGVDCGEILKSLMDRGLVRTAGRQESLGRPQLYATSKLFLEIFGCNSIAQLPPLET
jgi:segregation and condensation protein B